jgi:hypothetical protein
MHSICAPLLVAALLVSGCNTKPVPLVAAVAALPATVVAARIALAACARDNMKRFREDRDLTPSGLAYFVGLTCTTAREDYRHTLENAGVADVPTLMREIDTRIVAFIVQSGLSIQN